MLCPQCDREMVDKSHYEIDVSLRKPTDAQLRGIFTINKYLHKNYEAVTFAQAHRILSKWLDIALFAKADYEERYDDEYIDFDPYDGYMDSD